MRSALSTDRNESKMPHVIQEVYPFFGAKIEKIGHRPWLLFNQSPKRAHRSPRALLPPTATLSVSSVQDERATAPRPSFPRDKGQPWQGGSPEPEIILYIDVADKKCRQITNYDCVTQKTKQRRKLRRRVGEARTESRSNCGSSSVRTG